MFLVKEMSELNTYIIEPSYLSCTVQASLLMTKVNRPRIKRLLLAQSVIVSSESKQQIGNDAEFVSITSTVIFLFFFNDR